MKHLKYLLIATGLVFLTAFQCGDDCFRVPYGLAFQAVASDSTLFFDSIENVSEKQIVWRSTELTALKDSIYGYASWNPGEVKTTFCFYSGGETDTLRIYHEYDERYNEDCVRYDFHLRYSHVLATTFTNYQFSDNGRRVRIVLD